MDKYKAIFFDADGTLVNHKECERQALIHVFNSIGINFKDEYQNIFKTIENMLWDNEYHNGVYVPRDEVFTYRFKPFFKEININYDNYIKANDFFKAGLAGSVALIENADDVLEYLYNKSYMICVVTNGLVELQKPRVVNSKIAKFVSFVLVSEEVGAHKPNPLIFNTLLKTICLNPNDVIMVGDSLKNDIQGAKNAGIKSVWYNPEQIENETDILPDYEINNLLQLKDMF